MFCCVLLCVDSIFAIISIGKSKLVALRFFVFLVSHDWCVALHHDAMGLSSVCNCCISLSYQLFLLIDHQVSMIWARNYNAPLKLRKTLVKYWYFNMLYKMLNKLPGSIQYLWVEILLQFTEKMKLFFILISLKRYYSHPEKSILKLSLSSL